LISKLSSSVFGDSKEAPELVRLFVSLGFLNEKAERYKKQLPLKNPGGKKDCGRSQTPFFLK